MLSQHAHIFSDLHYGDPVRSKCKCQCFEPSRDVQAGWWSLFGYWSVGQLKRIYANDLGCTSELGAFRLCDASLHLSLYSSLFLLMTQALVHRILVPGVSNFVNSSVRRLILLEHASRRLLAHPNPNPCFVAEMFLTHWTDLFERSIQAFKKRHGDVSDRRVRKNLKTFYLIVANKAESVL